MSYYFINNRYPISDPNTDLNFNNDILYQHIVGDESRVAPTPYDNGGQVPRITREPDRKDIRLPDPTFNIMIIIAIVLLITLIAISS